MSSCVISDKTIQHTSITWDYTVSNMNAKVLLWDDYTDFYNILDNKAWFYLNLYDSSHRYWMCCIKYMQEMSGKLPPSTSDSASVWCVNSNKNRITELIFLFQKDEAKAYSLLFYSYTLRFDVLRPWRWRQYAPLKCSYLPTSPYSIATQKINTDVLLHFMKMNQCAGSSTMKYKHVICTILLTAFWWPHDYMCFMTSVVAYFIIFLWGTMNNAYRNNPHTGWDNEKQLYL